jgi:hypothetical protein
MEWNQVWTVVGINIGLFAALATLIIWIVNKIDSDIRNVGDRVDKLGNRLDGHAQRIDQLYQMFVDLLKNKGK